jgi:hypothetical protein
MTTLEQARAAALALPEAVEADHHGRPSFRVGGRIFATVPAPGRLNVMVDEDGVRSYVERDPRAYSEVWWGTRLAAVAVELALVEPAALRELLADAWERRAPARLSGRRSGAPPPPARRGRAARRGG